jgi:hypothetical protein
MKQILLIIAVVALVGCGKEDDANTGVVKPNLPSPKAAPEKLIAAPIVEKKNANALYRDWTHSYEEERPPNPSGVVVQIFRPTASRQFPLSRFRMRYIFHENRDLQYLYLHPADAHHMKKGTWNWSQGNRTILWKNAEGETGRFEILQVTRDILKITPRKSP